MKYAVVIEPTETGYSAYVPDVLGCVAVGETEAEVSESMREALQFHFEEMRLDGDAIPEATSRAIYVGVLQPTSRFAVIIEKGPASYGAYVPDVDGCVAVADTETEVTKLIREALELHLEAMQMRGEPIPEPASQVTCVEVTEPAPVA